MARVPSRGSDQFVLRFPPRMRDRIREAADANGRSMNAEILARLERAEAQGDSWEAATVVKQLVLALDDPGDERRRQAAVFSGLTFLADFPLEAARLMFVWERMRPRGVARAKLSPAEAADIDAMIDQMVAPELNAVLDHFRGIGWTVAPRNDEADRQGLDQDVRSIISFIETELDGGEVSGDTEMRTELGEKLSNAIGKRTEQAMAVVIDRLAGAGLLNGKEEALEVLVQKSA